MKIADFWKTHGKRFGALLGMLGSSADGERANAASLATRMLKEAGLTWADVSGSAPARDDAQIRWWRLKAEAAEAQAASYAQTIHKHRQEIERLKAQLASAHSASVGRTHGAFGAVAEEILRDVRNRTATEQAQRQRETMRAYEEAMRQNMRNQQAHAEQHSFEGYVRELVNACLARLPDVRAHERDFLTSIRGRNKLTEKQVSWLRDICHRAGVECGGLD